MVFDVVTDYISFSETSPLSEKEIRVWSKKLKIVFGEYADGIILLAIDKALTIHRLPYTLSLNSKARSYPVTVSSIDLKVSTVPTNRLNRVAKTIMKMYYENRDTAAITTYLLENNVQR